jgi:hypothetical protein
MVLVAAPAVASDFQSPRTAALGGAGHAGPLLNDAIYLNPSFVSLLATYAVSGNYFLYHGTGDSPDPHGHGLNASIQDGRSELFQAGVGYTLRENESILNIGASKQIVQRAGVGMGGKFIFPKDPSRPMIKDMTFSVTAVPYDIFQVAFIVDNLIESASEKSYGLLREYILGTKLNLQQIVLIYFDPHLAPDDPVNSSFGYETGIEWPIMNDFMLRAGMFRNSNLPIEYTRGRGYGIGVGWIAPRISFDYAFSRAIDPLAFSSHFFGFTAFF